MTLTLRIENYDLLEDGGPAQISVEGRGFQAGRGSAMDWVLPDPARHISTHHFDVAFVQGAYWLTDVSTNGTFLQGHQYRLEGPHRLTEGDRFQVGHYIIVTHLGQQMAAPPPASAFDTDNDPWSVGPASYAPIDPSPVSDNRRFEDFGDDFISNPIPVAPQPPAAPPAMPQQPAPPHAAMPAPPQSAPAEAPLPLTRPIVAPAQPVQTGPDPAAIIQAFCEGAGIPPGAYTEADAVQLAREIGKGLRVAVAEAMAMLQDRAAAKRFVKGSDRTMRSASDNNPLKFLPDAEQALEALFLRHRPGYLTGADGLSEALKDIRLHQAAIFAAMQPALAKLLAEIAPETIEEGVSGSVLAGRKGKAWEAFVERWDSMANAHENGMLDVYLEHFAEAYARAVTQQQS